MSHASRTSSAVSIACALLLAACSGGGAGGDHATDTTGKNDAPAAEQPPPPAPPPIAEPAPMPPAPPAPATPDTPANVAAVYEGRWKGCALATDAEASWSGSYAFTRLSDTTARYHFVKEAFKTLDCSGTAEGTLTVDGEVTWTGKTRAVAGVIADETLFVPANTTRSPNMLTVGNPMDSFKQVLVLGANALREGDRATQDADGYPAGFSAMRYANEAPPPPPPPPAPEVQ